MPQTRIFTVVVLILLCSVFGAFAAPVTLPSDKFDRLKSVLQSEGGKCLVRGDAGYLNYSSMFDVTCTETPTAVFVPNSEAGLKSVILSAVAHDLEVVVTTTRLNQACLSNTHGYVINMRNFHKMEFNADMTRIRIGAGAFNDEVNTFVQSKGEYYVPGLIATWGGTVGPIFGGGFFWSSIGYGSMADSAVEFRFMNYKGEIYTVSNTENADLFWALRGGGGQLGIVIEVVMKVYKHPSNLMFAAFEVPCENPVDCSTEGSRLALMNKAGHWQNTHSHVGTMFVFRPAPGIAFARWYLTCRGCDLIAEVKNDFPAAVQVETEFAGINATAKEFYYFLRPLTSGFIGGHNPTAPMTWDVINANYPSMPLEIGGYFFTEHTDDIGEMYRKLWQTHSGATTWGWSSNLGNTLLNDIDSAMSVQQGAKVFWALASVSGDQAPFLSHNREASKIPTAKAAYWNYKNKYTSEEFAFAYNLKRIREIRRKYDPNGFFTLPARRNEGSGYIDSCFAPYHCNGRGKLSSSSLNGIPANGCECVCDDGWSGQTCDIKTSVCNIKECGCPSYHQNWCTAQIAFMHSHDDYCQNPDRCSSDCAGVWCSTAGTTITTTTTTTATTTTTTTTTMNPGACYLTECRCPDNFLADWCNGSNALISSDECQASESLCGGGCNGVWCPTRRRLESVDPMMV